VAVLAVQAMGLVLGIAVCLVVRAAVAVQIMALGVQQHLVKVTLARLVAPVGVGLTTALVAVALAALGLSALLVMVVMVVLLPQIQFLEHRPTMLAAAVAVVAQALAREHLEV